MKLMQLIKERRVSSILMYMPMAHELNFRTLMRKLNKTHTVYVPFMVDDSFKMVRYSLPLRRAKFGIWQAKYSPRVINNVDMIVVPILGVDKEFKRIGFGKGMYDRFYERLENKPITVFVQQELLYTPHVITDHHDIQADVIITPKEYLLV